MSRDWIPVALLPFLAPSVAAQTPQKRTFEHPLHSVSIEAPADWQVVATGSEQRDSDVRETLTVIGAGPDAPTQGNYVLQVWCPETRRDSLAPMIESIVGSLRIGPAGS